MTIFLHFSKNSVLLSHLIVVNMIHINFLTSVFGIKSIYIVVMMLWITLAALLWYQACNCIQTPKDTWQRLLLVLTNLVFGVPSVCNCFCNILLLSWFRYVVHHVIPNNSLLVIYFQTVSQTKHFIYRKITETFSLIFDQHRLKLHVGFPFLILRKKSDINEVVKLYCAVCFDGSSMESPYSPTQYY